MLRRLCQGDTDAHVEPLVEAHKLNGLIRRNGAAYAKVHIAARKASKGEARVHY